MKRLVGFLISLMLMMPAAVYAAVGDVAGDVYPTDIKTYIFDEEINSYNIGGQTVIICEDLGWYYGFYVDWKAEERLLEITDELKHTGYVEDFSALEQRSISDRTRLRTTDYYEMPAPEHIYYTDIVTNLAGREIVSYNVNGRTAIIVEDLREFGYDVVWNEEDRTLKVYERFENIPIETDIGLAYSDGAITKYYMRCAVETQWKRRVAAGGEEMDFNTFSSQYNYVNMYPLKETFDFLNIKYSFENNILTIDTSEAKKDVRFVSQSVTDQYSDRKHNSVDGKSIDIMYIDKVILNGEETKMTYDVIVGHWEYMHTETYEAQPYVCGGVVYLPETFIREVVGVPRYDGE